MSRRDRHYQRIGGRVRRVLWSIPNSPCPRHALAPVARVGPAGNRHLVEFLDLSTIAVVRRWRVLTACLVIGLGALWVLTTGAMWLANPVDDVDRAPSARLLQISLVAWVAGAILLLAWVRRRR